MQPLKMHLVWLFAVLCHAAGASASGLDDFSNNLASDVAPLLALFGEKITIQYFSESTSFLDYFIFAMAPVGIVTAITSAIRVAGDASLRAFIGRAREGDGAVEVELCTSTSRDVCELFHRGGITRVFGRPKILEIVRLRGHGEEDKVENGQYVMGVYLFRDYLKRQEKNPNAAWVPTNGRKRASFTLIKRLLGSGQLLRRAPRAADVELAEKSNNHQQASKQPVKMPIDTPATVIILGPTEPESLPPSDGTKPIQSLDPPPEMLVQNPNLSINIGIMKPPSWVFGVVALVGFILQSGVIVMAAVISWKLQWTTDGPPENIVDMATAVSNNRSSMSFVIGTLCMCSGMLACAALIGESTEERQYRRRIGSPRHQQSQLFWIQPGNQVVGDETFDAFAYAEDINGKPLLEYTTSTKRPTDAFHPYPYTWTSAVLTVGGYIAQFIGLRGINASISIAQLGITLFMSILRACLRMRRLQHMDNLFRHFPDMVLGFELDELSFRLNRNDEDKANPRMMNWNIAGYSKTHNSESTPSDAVSHLERHLRYRTRLAHLTGHQPPTPLIPQTFQTWSNEQVHVRNMAQRLAAALCGTAEALLGIRQSQMPVTIGVLGTWREKSVDQVPEKRGWQSDYIELCIHPSSDGSGSGWAVDSSKIEAILGLWLWSLKRNALRIPGFRDSGWLLVNANDVPRARIHSSSEVSQGLGNADDFDAMEDELALWLGHTPVKLFRGTIENQHLAKSCYTSAIWASSDQRNWSPLDADSHLYFGDEVGSQWKQFFGWNAIPAFASLDNWYRPHDPIRILYTHSNNSLLTDCCQDLYSALVRSLVYNVGCEFDGVTLSRVGDQLCLEDPKISAMITAFTDNGLGSHSDAVLCIIPGLRNRMKPKSNESLEPALMTGLRHGGGEKSRAEALLEYRRPEHVGEDEIGQILDRYGVVAMQRAIDCGEEACLEGLPYQGLPAVPKPNGLVEVISDKKRAETLYLLCVVPQQLLTTELEAALPLAARNRWHEVVRALLELGAFVDGQNVDGRAALSYYCENGGPVSMVRLLLDAGAHPDLVDEHKRTPLWWAAGSGDRETVKVLRDTGKVLLDAVDDQGRSPASQAAEKGHREVLRMLRDTGLAQMDLVDHKGRSPLSYAAETGHEAIVRDLIGLTSDRRVNANQQDDTGRTPLSWAAGAGHVEVVKVLIDLPVVELGCRDNEGRTPLIRAVENGHIEVVKELCAKYKGARLGADVYGLTPLDWAARVGSQEMVEILSAAVDISVPYSDDMGRTALWWAARGGSVAIATVLLQRVGFDVDQPDDAGRTPLWWAARNGNEEMVHFLLKRGADASIRDMAGQTALWWAVRNGYRSIVQLLLETDRAKPGASGTKGQTPLMWAARRGDAEMTKMLLGKLDAADARARDDDGRTALSWALKYGQLELARLLSAATGRVEETDWDEEADFGGMSNRGEGGHWVEL
ncbi:Ankyrin repeat domain-containing protein 50 [Madurella mycetomatis]|uniref:Ankyrin repeat domain-containing protein 50 n=1 Tax=Madurella mycetomatis TaxID=100816 RepID=A0A175VV69_9PEZI|nr:Ankyrin repeat domain-containing protein 50 [Madurella mycetomatis]